jgi:Tol biopolymer transport system component
VEQVRVFGDEARVRLTYWFQPAPDADPRFSQEQPAPWPFDVAWFYRQDEDGVWYHTDPPGDYVGVSHSWHGTWMDIYARRVESEWLGDAMGDMFLIMYHACNLLNCPEDEHYELRFEDAPGPQIHETGWILPALYLTGLPADSDAARSAWLQGVNLWLLESLVQDLIGEDAGDSLVYGYLAARLQAELGLLEPPAPDVEILEQAINQEQLHPLWSLWETRYDPDDAQTTRLHQAEVAALLQLIEAQVGPERFFQSLPELNGYTRLGDVLEEIYGLDRTEFMDYWYAHLSSLTGVDRSSLLLPDLQVEQPLSPEGALQLAWPFAVPGDQVALNCDGQILVGNVDGSRLVPLTSDGYRFSDPLWSPDGRWLLSVWQRQRGQSESLIVMAVDGRSFWFLDEDWTGLQPLGWSHDGRKIYYWAETVSGQERPGYWTMNVETRQSRRLPLWAPVFSPDGRRVAYFALPYQDAGDPLWLADVNDQAVWGEEWENARQLEREAGTNVMDVSWSPDGERLALVLWGESAGPNDYGDISIYDLTTERLTPLVSASKLRDVALSSAGDLLTGKTAPPILELEGTLTSLSISGWSVDGSYILVGATSAGLPDEVTLLVPLDGSLPRLLSFGVRGQSDYAAWSPTDSDRLFFIESLYSVGSGLSSGYLLDLENGPIYTTTRVLGATWSPDGEWLAFDGQNQLTVVDQDGQPRSVLSHDCDSVSPAWNPAADLALPDVECRAGLDLWLDPQDVYRAGDNLVVTVHNGGTQNTPRLWLVIDSAASGDTSSSSNRWMYGGNLVVPACGSLLLRLAFDDLPDGPLTLTVNPLDVPDALPELDYDNNQVTLDLPAP